MASVNECIFVGNLGRDTELRQTSGGNAVGSNSLAVKSGYGDREKTEWINFTVWGKTAEALERYTSKGDMVYISGEFVTEKWEDKSGNQRESFKINVNKLQFLKTKSKEDGGGQKKNDYDDSDIPF